MAESSDVLDLEGEIRRSVDEIHGERVEHNDVREPNILWNAERGRAMLIDLKHSRLLRPAVSSRFRNHHQTEKGNSH